MIPKQNIRCFGLFCAAMLFLPPTVSAQDSIGTDINVDAPLAAKRLQAEALEVTYDRFEDVSTITTGYIAGENFDVALLWTCEGNQFCQPQNGVTLAFRSSTRTWKYLRNQELIFLLDGKARIPLGQITRTGDVHRNGHVTEIMGVRLQVSTMKRILSANRIEYRLGGTATKFNWSQKQELRQALQDLYDWEP